MRAYHLLQHMRSRAHVHVVSLVHDEEEARHANEVAAFAESIHVARVPRLRNLAKSLIALPTDRPTTHSMLDSPHLTGAIAAALQNERPDVVLAFCSGCARWALEPALRGFPLVLDMVDVDSAKWADLAHVTSQPLAWVYRREGRTLGRFEALAAAEAVATMVVTERERAALLALAPAANVHVVPNGVDVEALAPRSLPAPSSTVVFCGMMDYPPNAHAALFLGREIWPLVRASRPDASLAIVGARPTAVVRALASAADGIVVTGAVSDVRPYLWDAAVAAVPLQTARGIQNKVLEAVAAGLPVVVTPNVAHSLPAELKPAISIGEGKVQLAHAIVALLNETPEARRARAAAAGVAALAWDHQLAAVLPLLEIAATVGADRRAL